MVRLQAGDHAFAQYGQAPQIRNLAIMERFIFGIAI